ncbi:MAG: hypothetical protein K8S97_11725, partial [Anaerolineae bacterium]|nr:hypothetical protein [Anaerolineae bacterium]
MLDTANFNHSTLSELDRLLRQLADLEGMLRAQHEILLPRGMSDPTSVLENVHYVRQTIDTLKWRIAGETAEIVPLRAGAETTRLIASQLVPDQVLEGVMYTALALIGA